MVENLKFRKTLKEACKNITKFYPVSQMQPQLTMVPVFFPRIYLHVTEIILYREFHTPCFCSIHQKNFLMPLFFKYCFNGSIIFHHMTLL